MDTTFIYDAKNHKNFYVIKRFVWFTSCKNENNTNHKLFREIITEDSHKKGDVDTEQGDYAIKNFALASTASQQPN